MNFLIKAWLRLARGLLLAVGAAALLGGCSLLTSPYPGPRPSGGYPAPAPTPAPPPISPSGSAGPSGPAGPSGVQPGPTAGRPMEPPPPAQVSPKVQASLNVTDQGRQLLLGGQAEEAISVLERATGMNPDNGEAYYWLAEAWLEKGNAKQSLEYHHQAWLPLRAQPGWSARLRDQRERMQHGGR